MHDVTATIPLMPVKTGIQCFDQELDSRFRGNERSVWLRRSNPA
jgi:hypothetical protein